MRDLLFQILFRTARALRPADKRVLAPLRSNGTVLYLQFEKPLGCCIHGTPLVDALAASAPGVRVVVATRGSGAATLLHHPRVHQLIETENDPLASTRALWSTAAALRKQLVALGLRPDVVVQDASSRRGTWALFAALLRLAPTVGFADARALYDQHLPYDPHHSLIENNLRLAAALGGPAVHREPKVFFSADDLQHARELLQAAPKTRTGRIGFVLQGSGGQRTGWHDERFAEVVRFFEANHYETVFFGTMADAHGIERVRTLAQAHGRSLAGLTSIAQAAAALCLCDLLITVDTGTMHLGRAVGVPMVVLGPSWQRPLEWLPLDVKNVRILRGPDQETVPENYHLDEIEVSDVLAAATALLQSFPPAAPTQETRVHNRLSAMRT